MKIHQIKTPLFIETATALTGLSETRILALLGHTDTCKHCLRTFCYAEDLAAAILAQRRS